jgi:hypothetical protein
MKNLVFVNVNFIGNAGDFWCTPLKYYNFEKYNPIHVHFMDVWHYLNNEAGHEHGNIRDSVVVLGGGGLLTTDGNFIQQTTEFLVKNNKVIFWGVGSNTFETPTYDILKHPNVLLSGIRDIVYGVDVDYLPCVSCKHKVFDQEFIEGESVGLIEHPRHPITITEYEKITNQSEIDKIISFIRSKKTILSSTFHGCYWSQLLDKKVLYVKTIGKINSKIVNMKNRVLSCDSTDYFEKIKSLSSTNGVLNESRKLNDDFYNKTINILETIL